MSVSKSHVPDRSRTVAEHNRMKSFGTREFLFVHGRRRVLAGTSTTALDRLCLLEDRTELFRVHIERVLVLVVAVYVYQMQRKRVVRKLPVLTVAYGDRTTHALERTEQLSLTQEVQDVATDVRGRLAA